MKSSHKAEDKVQGVGKLQRLPDVILLEVGQFTSESDVKKLAHVSKTMHSIFQPIAVLFNKFLECVAFGKQDEVEKLFNRVYSGHETKIQEALRYRGVFTDYSSRTFNCSAYEYAYWAKDTHMCRMLERYMDEDTKAIILARITTNDETGLSYQQNGAEHRSAHFDLTPLKGALQAYVNGYNRYSSESTRAVWLAVGMAQRDVPAHVAQEYCRKDRSFHPHPRFNEASLPRILSFSNSDTHAGPVGRWFPQSHNSGLGFDFSCQRADYGTVMGSSEPVSVFLIEDDLAAINRLDEVRTADLEITRANLSSATSLRLGG